MINSRITLKNFFSAAALIVLLFGFNPFAASAVLVNQPFLSNDESFLSSVNKGFENADSFTLPNAVNLTSIAWWGSDAGITDANDFLVRIGTTLGSWTNLAGVITKSATSDVDNEDREIFRFEQVFTTPISLIADTHFLSISQEAEEWFWTVGSLDTAFGHPGNFFGDGQVWFNDDLAELSFQLLGKLPSSAVPEPGMIVLFLIGILTFGMRRRRRMVARAE